MKNIKRILVIDIEATCWDDKYLPNDLKYRNEIIEIGITELDKQHKKLDVVQSESIIIKPKWSEISPFCTQLTTLTKEYVDAHGMPFHEAINYLEQKYNPRKAVFASWGEYDKNIFYKNCEWHKTRYPFSNLHLNIKALHAATFGYTGGVDAILKDKGIVFEGTQHRGVDDSKMIAKLLLEMI